MSVLISSRVFYAGPLLEFSVCSKRNPFRGSSTAAVSSMRRLSSVGVMQPECKRGLRYLSVRMVLHELQHKAYVIWRVYSVSSRTCAGAGVTCMVP